jgi:hypothetical protein
MLSETDVLFPNVTSTYILTLIILPHISGQTLWNRPLDAELCVRVVTSSCRLCCSPCIATLRHLRCSYASPPAAYRCCSKDELGKIRVLVFRRQ